MLKPLRTAIAQWAPPRTRDDDPLAAIVAGWPSIVGAGVAEQARPVAIVADALIVVVRSSAWSQQMAFLSGDIVAGLRTIPEAAGIARLRFRLGSPRPGRRTGAVPKSAVSARRTKAQEASPPAESADEALRRFRQHVGRRRHAAGNCTACGSPHGGGGPCAPCADASRQSRMLVVQRLMYEAPWLGFAEIARLAGGVERAEFDGWRRALLARWWEILQKARWTKRATSTERRIASSYVLLQSGLEPDRVSPAVVLNLLGPELAALLYEVRG